MASVRPGKYNPLKPDIELYDYKSKKRFGLKLDGSGALQVGTVSQDDTVHIRTAGKKIGDFDEQRSWKAGRGIEDLTTNASGFWDSMNAWTLAEGHVHQTLLWRFARGLRSADFFMPDATHSMSWYSITSTSSYLSMSFSSSGFTADYIRLWLRRVGAPGALTVRLHSDSSGNPGTVLQTVSINAGTIGDTVSVLQLFDFTGTQALSAFTTYHITVYGSGGTHNKTNHFDVGGYRGGTTGKSSTNGTSWSVANFDMYYYVADADIKRTFFPFFLDNAMYLVSKNDDGSASKLWINGDRGKATGATSTTLTQSTKTWIASRWIGAWVKIIRGTGSGQCRQITANTSTQLTVATWDVTPSTDSEYIIYATEWFTELIGHGLGVVASAPIVVNQIVYVPQVGAAIRIILWNATTVAHGYGADGTNQATFMLKASDGTGTRVWRILNSATTGSPQISYGTAVAYSTSPAAISYSTAIDIGDATYKATGIAEKDGLVYIFREDGIWNVSLSTAGTMTVVKLQSGIDKTPSSSNGASNIVHQQFMYYSWLHSTIRVYGSSHDDVGQDWSGKGLPDGREGVMSSFDAYTSLLICGVDAKSGTSSVLGFDGIGWHEMLRAYDSNKRIRMVKVQPCQDTRNRQWTDVGGDLVFQEMPLFKGSPRLDSGCRYQHEAVIESSAIDMGTASALPKFIKELTVYCENLGAGNEIYVDYQVDDDVHTTRWTPATVLYESPEATAFFGLSNVRKFAYRLRIVSDDNTLPVDVLGVVPNGYARVPYKMVWTLRCRADNITSRGRLARPDELMRWLLDNARYPGRLEMRSQYELAHKFFVIVHPPRMFPYKPAQNGQAEESVFTVVLEEA